MIYRNCLTDIKKIDEIPETQQPALASPSASRKKAGYRKRRAEIEPNNKKAPEIKRKTIKNMHFVADRTDINFRNQSIHGSECGDKATKTEVQALRERIETNKEIIKFLFQAIGLLGNRLNKVENRFQEHDWKHFGAITSFRRDFNRTDRRVFSFLDEKDGTNNTLI